MIIKKYIKLILAQWYKFKIKFHRSSKTKICIDDAIKIIQNVYTPLEYECKGMPNSVEEVELSLIVPVYNSERFIKECLESLINQNTSRKYEIILIDDGSKDLSGQIMDSYAHIPFIKIYHQENQGISKTRNRGIELSRGKYIGFVDNDDYVDKNYIETLLSCAERTNADIVKCGCVEFDSDTRKILHDFGRHINNSISGYIGEQIFNYDGFIWGGCYRSEFWDKVQFPNGYWYEDMITRFLLYRRSQQFEYIGESLYFKREHSSNSAKTIWKSGNVKCLDQYFLLEKLILISDEYNLPRDKVLARMCVSELGFMLGHRTFDLDDKIREAIFVMGSTLYCQFPIEYDFIDQYRYCETLRKCDYQLWKLITKYRKLIY